MKTLKHRNVDLLKAFTKKPELTKQKRDLLFMLIPVALAVVVFAAVAVVKTVELSEIKAKIAEEESYALDPAVAAKYAEYEGIVVELGGVQALYDELAAGEYAADSYPVFKSSLIDDALAAASRSITVRSYTYSDDGGVLAFTGTTNTVLSVSEYVKALDALGCFSDVGYYGYASQNGRLYNFTAYCVIDRGEQDV